MRLINRIMLRLSAVLLIVIALWGSLFCFAVIREVNDETDDSLENYSSFIIAKMLAGKIHLSDRFFSEENVSGRGSNNSYSIVEVDSIYAMSHRHVLYYDEDIFIPEKNENEPARILVRIFRDSEGKFYEVTVSTPTIEKDDLLFIVITWSIVLYLSLLILILVITSFIFYRSMRPLFKLLEWIDSYKPGTDNRVVPNDTDIVEFRKLNLATQRAIDRVEDVFEKQKEFIGNASHELQTPLAVIGNRIDLLMDTELSESQMEDLIKVKRTLGQVAKTNRTLLLLSKIENQQFPESSAVNLSDLIIESKEVCQEIYSSKEIVCTLSIPERFEVVMNESLAAILISNLVKNAFFHTPAHGAINISADGRRLVFENTGIAALDEANLFRRFGTSGERGREGGAFSGGSNGLGLAIVKAVCNYYDFRIEYRFDDGRHIFAVSF